MNKRDYLKPEKELLHSKRNNQQNYKTTYYMGENILQQYLIRGLYLKYTKNSLQFNSKKKKKERKQSYWENSQKTRWDRNISKRDMQVVNRYMKICSTLLIIAVVPVTSCINFTYGLQHVSLPCPSLSLTFTQIHVR